jgi:hypothetical protein
VEEMPAAWKTTTHDSAQPLDLGHVDEIPREPETFAPGGALHLVLEVLAYAAEEADLSGSGRSVVTLHHDGPVAVADNGRGTDTRIDDRGRVVRKPVMATKERQVLPAAAARRFFLTDTRGVGCRWSLHGATHYPPVWPGPNTDGLDGRLMRHNVEVAGGEQCSDRYTVR